MILGISSPGEILSIALVNQEQKVVAEINLDGQKYGCEEIIPMLDSILQKANLSLTHLEKIGVIVGPGSYTGLRGGLATAKSIAQARNIPVVGISALEAIAFNLVDLEGTLMVASAACRQDYNLALFGVSQSQLKRLTEDFVLDLETIHSFFVQIKGRIFLVSNRDEVYAGISNPKVNFCHKMHSIPYARNVAILGLNKNGSSFLDLVPNYSHQPNIREIK